MVYNCPVPHKKQKDEQDEQWPSIRGTLETVQAF